MGIAELRCENCETEFAMARSDFDEADDLSCPACRRKAVYEVVESDHEEDDDEEDSQE